MLLEEKHCCDKCNKDFEWYYQVPQHISKRLSAQVLPKNKVAVSPLTRNEDMTPIKVSVYCPHCDYRISFDVDYENVTITK